MVCGFGYGSNDISDNSGDNGRVEVVIVGKYGSFLSLVMFETKANNANCRS